MATQDDQDWVDYQLGLQGTSTGSMHNQQGLSDRPSTDSGNNSSRQRKQETQAKNTQKQNNRVASSSDKNGLSYLVAVIVGIAALMLLIQPLGENLVLAYIFAGIAAFIAQRYYKVILVITLCVAGVYFFNQ